MKILDLDPDLAFEITRDLRLNNFDPSLVEIVECKVLCNLEAKSRIRSNIFIKSHLDLLELIIK